MVRLNAYLYPDRSLYQPGETVFLSALLRDAGAVAVQNRALTLKVQRPDGARGARGSGDPAPARRRPDRTVRHR